MATDETWLEDLLMEPKQPKIGDAGWFAERHEESVGHQTSISSDLSENGEILISCLDCPWKLWVAG